MTEHITICEVGPRDGLQNEAAPMTSAQKIALTAALVGAGARYIELTSFVNPKAVPQMADADAVMRAAVAAHPDVRFTGLVLNEAGYERARAAGCNAIAYVLVVSETLSQRNSRRSTDAALTLCQTLLARAQADGVWTRVYLATAWVCPYEGAIAPERVLAYADAVWAAGVDEMALADTIGHAHPVEVGRLVAECGRRYDLRRLAVHLHDTQALGLANTTAALAAGARIFDASIGGLGGCPFAPGAAGNLATEDLVLLAHKLGYATGFDLAALWAIVGDFGRVVGREIGGRSGRWWRSSQPPGDDDTAR